MKENVLLYQYIMYRTFVFSLAKEDDSGDGIQPLVDRRTLHAYSSDGSDSGLHIRSDIAEQLAVHLNQLDISDSIRTAIENAFRKCQSVTEGSPFRFQGEGMRLDLSPQAMPGCTDPVGFDLRAGQSKNHGW